MSEPVMAIYVGRHMPNHFEAAVRDDYALKMGEFTPTGDIAHDGSPYAGQQIYLTPTSWPFARVGESELLSATELVGDKGNLMVRMLRASEEDWTLFKMFWGDR